MDKEAKKYCMEELANRIALLILETGTKYNDLVGMPMDEVKPIMNKIKWVAERYKTADGDVYDLLKSLLSVIEDGLRCDKKEDRGTSADEDLEDVCKEKPFEFHLPRDNK